MRLFILPTFLLSAIALSPACGGSTPPAKPTVHRQQETAVTDDSDNQPAPSGPDCSDGTCFKCGQALCLPGFYCDESGAVATCQWLSKCGKGAGCGCIQQTLGAGCHCSDREGGLFVKCSS